VRYRSWASNSPSSAPFESTSQGISRNTGPGRPARARRNARARKLGTRSGEGIRSDHLVIPAKSWVCGISWSEPRPWLKVGAAPPSSTRGELAAQAFATPVTASVTPGPAVTIATPTPRVRRAQASAAWAAACSWRVSTSRIPSSTQPA